MYDLATAIKDSSQDSVFQMMAIMGGFIILYGLVSLFVKERLYITESFVATLVGIVFGPVVIGLINPGSWFPGDLEYRVLKELGRMVIAIQVMTVGVSLPKGYLKSNIRGLLMFLGPVMLFMWTVSSLLIKAVLGTSWAHAFIIGGCVTPTDPVLAHSVIKGKFANRYIPQHLRALIAAESGANDGLALPLLMLPVYLLVHNYNVAETLQSWFLVTLLYEIALSTLIGLIFGYTFRILLQKSEKYNLVDKESFLVFTIALAMFVSGTVTLIASDDLWAVFIAGITFSADEWFAKRNKEAHLQEVIDMLFNMTFFVYFGAVIPWESFAKVGLGKLFLVAFLILMFRRLPIVYALRQFIPQLKTRREAFFAGWFGPIGVGAAFFLFLSLGHLSHSHGFEEANKEMVPIVFFIILSSIVVHGITVPITNMHLKRRLKRKIKKQVVIEALAFQPQVIPLVETTTQESVMVRESEYDSETEQELPFTSVINKKGSD